VTIRPGEEWGTEVDRPPELVTVSGDAALAERLLTDERPPLAVSAGDLHRALGSPGERKVVQRVPIDRLQVTADGRRLSAVAHVVARGRWWRGPIIAVMNVDHLGRWNVAPRAHPNDGRFDVVEVAATMSLRRRWQARSRLPLGTHVPHPEIAVRTATHAEWLFDRPLQLWLDGERHGSVGRLSVTIEPDAFALHA
jgi:hypothetical protein